MAKKNILIAEDEKPMAKVLEAKLNKAGFNAKAVFDGAQALKELESGQYDLILLDLMMPNLDGWGVMEKMKDKGVKTPVIVTSNLGQETDEEEAKKLGAVDYLVKANTPMAEIVEKVSSFLK